VWVDILAARETVTGCDVLNGLFVNDFCVVHDHRLRSIEANARKRLTQQYPPGRPCAPGLLRIVGAGHPTGPLIWHPTRDFAMVTP
jgi:hypothetical protein